MVIPNTVTEFQSFYIFETFVKCLTCRLPRLPLKSLELDTMEVQKIATNVSISTSV